MTSRTKELCLPATLETARGSVVPNRPAIPLQVAAIAPGGGTQRRTMPGRHVGVLSNEAVSPERGHFSRANHASLRSA